MYLDLAQTIVQLGIVPGVTGILGLALVHVRTSSTTVAARPALREAVPCAVEADPVPADDDDGATVPYVYPRRSTVNLAGRVATAS